MAKQQSKVAVWTWFFASISALVLYVGLVYGLSVDLTHNFWWTLAGGALSMLILTLVWRYLHMDNTKRNDGLNDDVILKIALVLVFVLLVFDLWLIWLAKVQLMVL